MKRLRTSLGLTKSWYSARRRKCALATTDFVRRLAARYGSARAAMRRIDLPLASGHPMFVQVLLRYSFSPQPLRAPVSRGPIFPAIALELRRSHRGTGQMVLLGNRPLAALPVGFAGHRDLVCQIVQRTQRVEVGRNNARAALEDTGQTDIYREPRPGSETSLPLVLPAVPGVQATQADRSADTLSAPARGKHAFTATAGMERQVPAPRTLRALAIPEQELDRLTERVIGTIDRRIAAQRERLGRP